MGVKQQHPKDGGKWEAYKKGGEEKIGTYDTRGEAVQAYEAPPKKKGTKKKG